VTKPARGLAEHGTHGDTIAHLDSIVARAELPEATKLYRGVDADGLKAMLAEYHLSVGTVISDRGFVSTSRLPEVAKHNAGQGG
jgi:hypothetical protein